MHANWTPSNSDRRVWECLIFVCQSSKRSLPNIPVAALPYSLTSLFIDYGYEKKLHLADTAQYI